MNEWANIFFRSIFAPYLESMHSSELKQVQHIHSHICMNNCECKKAKHIFTSSSASRYRCYTCAQFKTSPLSSVQTNTHLKVLFFCCCCCLFVDIPHFRIAGDLIYISFRYGEIEGLPTISHGNVGKKCVSNKSWKSSMAKSIKHTTLTQAHTLKCLLLIKCFPFLSFTLIATWNQTSATPKYYTCSEFFGKNHPNGVKKIYARAIVYWGNHVKTQSGFHLLRTNSRYHSFYW